MIRRWNLLAWILLASVFLGISIYLFLNPTRTGVVPNYRFAATEWWASLSLYPGGTHKYLYIPTFAVLFSPLNFIRPEILGEILWRAFGFGLFTLALWRLSKNNSPIERLGTTAPTFFTMVLLAVPASLASLNNGQTNLPLSACLVLVALALRDQRWNLAASLLTLSLVLKPIALAPWLLAFAVIAAMRIPLFLGILLVGLVGFFHLSPAYALGQWGEFFQKLMHSYTPENLRVSDLFGLLQKMGIPNTFPLNSTTRLTGCLAVLGFVFWNFRKKGPTGASWAVWVGTTLVFTLFNPRAETNSYVLISPVLAYAAISYWREVEGGRWKGLVLAAACIGLMCDGMGLWIYKATDVWFKPLIVLLVSPLLIRMPEAWKQKK